MICNSGLSDSWLLLSGLIDSWLLHCSNQVVSQAAVANRAFVAHSSVIGIATFHDDSIDYGSFQPLEVREVLQSWYPQAFGLTETAQWWPCLAWEFFSYFLALRYHLHHLSIQLWKGRMIAVV
jgi:hypothetical protein